MNIKDLLSTKLGANVEIHTLPSYILQQEAYDYNYEPNYEELARLQKPIFKYDPQNHNIELLQDKTIRKEVFSIDFEILEQEIIYIGAIAFQNCLEKNSADYTFYVNTPTLIVFI